MEIVIEAKKAFAVHGKSVAKIVIGTLNFVTYAECFKARVKEMNKSNDDTQATKAFQRAKRIKQVKAFDKSGTEIILDHVAFANMPRPLFVQINNAMDNTSSARGSVISTDGDGLYTPILYKLGTPFDFQDSTHDSKPIGTESKIVELEFIAKTGGDIEDVLCGENSLDQTVALIKTCATPLGGDTALQRLPSWMLSSLTLADGIEIMSKVLPVFLE